MSRYIDSEAIMEIVRDGYHSDFGRSMADLTSLREPIEDTPTADVAEVIRCKDCMFYTPYKLEGYEGLGDCSRLLWLEFCVKDDFFCGYGERMGGETE